MSNPPTPRRCRRILEAHHLDCQGIPPDDIAKQLRCARSTVYAYFRDFQLHQAHILRTVAADRLADQVHILTSPGTDPDQHRQTVAATRELCLLLQSLSAIPAIPTIKAHEPPTADPADSPYAILDDPEALLHQWETRVDPDGHHRHIRGPAQGECMLICPACLPPLDNDLVEPGTTNTEPEQPSQIPLPSGPIQTNLDKSGQESEANPTQDNKSEPIPPNSPPRPRNPQNWPTFTPPHRPNRSVVIPLPDIGRY